VNIRRDILLIDEVLGAGDAKFKEKSQQKMTELLTGGETIILVSHSMDAIRRFANKVILLDGGHIIAQGEPEEIINKYLHL
jgi:ABC-type polysaccharide/polyol phosphate transport system ATPase subunit